MADPSQDQRASSHGGHTSQDAGSSGFEGLLQGMAWASDRELAGASRRGPAPAPEVIGPYRVVSVLGRGGMGVVYRAEHLETGQAAALKTVLLPDQRLLESIRREIHALAHIRHPGVVRILDEGLHEGLPWYAMELLDGMTLRRYCGGPATPIPDATGSTWWTEELATRTGLDTLVAGSSKISQTTAPSVGGQSSRPGFWSSPSGLPLPGILTLMRRLCAPLAYLHGEGIVHRDLKPENILIRAASSERRAASGEIEEGSTLAAPGWPVVMDFGLVSRFGGPISRESLDAAGLSAGTLAYMAPEQARGELVDARADLYALGCILFELLTGRRPFVGSSAAELRRQHLYEAPLRPSQLVAGIPADLDELVLRLMAKRPQERLGHADDVASALARLGGEDEPANTGPPARAYLYRPGFAGRAETLERLLPLLGRLETGAGALVLVGGESGVGKTRLALELAQRAEARRIRVVAGECQSAGGLEADTSGGASLLPFRSTLRTIADHCRKRGQPGTEHLLGRRGKVLALYEPAFAHLAGQDAYPDPAEIPANAARLRLYSDLAETLERFARDQPLLLVLDDLQWGDELSLGFLEFLLRSGSLESTPLLLLGLYRTEELGQATPLRGLLESREVEVVKLGRLETDAIRQMAGDMLALSPAPAVLARFLARHSEGNPFFVAEYLRLAVEEQVFYRDDRGRWQVSGDDGEATEALYERLTLPRSLRELVGRRLDGLPPEGVALVAAAAVVGREVPAALLAALTRLSEHAERSALAEALRRQVLEEAGTAAFRFVHDKIREVAYERIGQAERRDLHRAAAEAIEGLFPEQRDEQLGTLAHHREAAGETERARADYLEAGRRAMRRAVPEEALRFARHAGRLGADAPARLVSVEALIQMARYDEVLAETREILGLPEATEEERLLARVHAAQALLLQGHFLGSVAEAEAVLRSAPPLQIRVKALKGVADSLWRLARIEEALAVYTEILEIGRKLGNREMISIALSGLGNVHYERGDFEAAIACTEGALAIKRELGLPRRVAMELNNLGHIHLSRGAYDDARRLWEESLASHRALGDPVGIAMNLNNLGVLHFYQGAYAEALEVLTDSLGIRQRIGDRRGVAATRPNVGNVHFCLGNLQEAREGFQKGLADAQEVQSPLLISSALERLGELHIALGDSAEAERSFAESLRIAEESTSQERLAAVLLGYARLRLEQRAAAEGRRYAERALELWIGLGNSLQQGAAAAVLARFEALDGSHAEARHKMDRALALVPYGSDFNLHLQLLEDDAVIRLSAADLEGTLRVAHEAAELARAHSAGLALTRVERLLRSAGRE